MAGKSVEAVLAMVAQLREQKAGLERKQAENCHRLGVVEREAGESGAVLARVTTRRGQKLGELGAVKARVAVRQEAFDMAQCRELQSQDRIRRAMASAEEETRNRSEALRQYEEEINQLCSSLGQGLLSCSSLSKVEAKSGALEAELEQVEREIRQLQAKAGEDPAVSGSRVSEDWEGLVTRVEWMAREVRGQGQQARDRLAAMVANRNKTLMNNH